MLIPSIDLMGGKIVQLVQGETKAYETTDFDAWCDRFAGFPMVQLIDLDAAKRQGDNRKLIESIVQRLPCQVGGGVRDSQIAKELLEVGARRVIVGSAYLREGQVDADFARQLAEKCGTEQLIAAVDSRGGRVTVRGWQESAPITAEEMIAALDSYVSGFLYTHVDTEGLLAGFPSEIARRLRGLTSRQLIAAGGIRSHEEIQELETIGVDAVVGMAIYTGRLRIQGRS